MAHELYDVEAFTIVGSYTLAITFDDGSTQVIDFEPMLHGELFGPLRDLSVFNQVRFDLEIRNLVWPNDAALDPETLRNWPLYADEMIKMAQRWASVPA
jgi:hypothetical protein